MSAIAMDATTSIKGERRTVFDTDSDTIGVDNRATACMSHEVGDFVGPLTEVN